MPGCEGLTPAGPGAYSVTLRVGIAPLKGTYSGSVRVADQRPQDAYRLVVGGTGRPGSLQGEAQMELADEPGGTVVRYHGDLRAQGAIALAGGRALGGAAKILIGQFMKGMEKQVAARVR
jgi:carbon monoxide dehydrogenase subunit G